MRSKFEFFSEAHCDRNGADASFALQSSTVVVKIFIVR